MQLRQSAQPAATASLIFAFACFLLASAATAQAQAANAFCGSDEYMENLPIKAPEDPAIKRQVQLVNCSDQVVLGAASAARAGGAPPYPVFPLEGTWVMQPFDPKHPDDYSNVLTINVPPEWYGQHVGGNTGNFWVRTGCRYDPVANRAQCETGGCSGQYDCSSGNISPPALTTIVEWTFYQHFDNTADDLFIDSPDISAVNGTNLTVDVSPKGGDDLHPGVPTDWHWLNWNYPLVVHGADLREPGNCQTSPTNTFKVTRSDIDKTLGGDPGYPLFGYVIVDGNGVPTMPTGNNILSCKSNCAQYKFPVETGEKDCDTKNDPGCYFWTTICAGNEAINYNNRCITGKCPTNNPNCAQNDKYYCDTDSDCLPCNGDVDYHIACFKKAGPGQRGVCELRGFNAGTVAQCNGAAGTKCEPSTLQCAAPTSSIACTNTYGSINPLDDTDATRFDYNDQPILGKCSDIVFQKTGMRAKCIGEDTLHSVLHGAYTWPNDPQVYQSNAKVYRMIFAPEGRGRAPITKAAPIPACDDLPSNYKPAAARSRCADSINKENASLAVAKVRNLPPNQWQSNGMDWGCSVGSERDSADNGIMCYWNPPPADYNCLAPKTDDTYVTESACGRIDFGTSLVSSSITPSNGDPLILEVSIPSVLTTVNLPSSVRGCAGTWSLIASGAVKTNQGIVAWYKGTANTSSACTVTVTARSSNPAELKLYDVPKFNGTVETMSTMSGDCGSTCDRQGVTAGTATTAFSSDLQMGALLMVNQTTAPITYWENWLSNGNDQSSPNCMLNVNKNCPFDDGTDYLPGHGAHSANSDVGHNQVAPGTQYFHYNAHVISAAGGRSNFSWLGLAIYLELKP